MRGGAKGGAKTIIVCSPKCLSAPVVRTNSCDQQEPYTRFPGIFLARGKEDMLVTKNLTPGESVYGEKRISVESSSMDKSIINGDATPATKTEYRVWNPFRYVNSSMLAPHHAYRTLDRSSQPVYWAV